MASEMFANSSGHIIYSEILSVTSVMRTNSRWSSNTQTFYTRDSALASNLGLRRPGTNADAVPQQGSREEDLMLGFEQLKRTLRSTQGTFNVHRARIVFAEWILRRLVYSSPRHPRSFSRHYSLPFIHRPNCIGCSFCLALFLRMWSLLARRFTRRCRPCRTQLSCLSLQV